MKDDAPTRVACRLTARRWDNRPNILLEGLHIPRLDINRPRTLEAAHQALSRLSGIHKSTTSFFNFIVHVPCYEVAVVDDMLLTRLQLYHARQQCSIQAAVGR